MDNESEKSLNEKEMFCLSKHIQELKEIVYNSCSTCKYQTECVKDNFKFEENTLLHLERITNNVCRRYCYKSDPKEINISVSLGGIANTDDNVDMLAEKIYKKLEKVTLNSHI